MKKLLFVMLVMFCVLPLFAKSYTEYLAEAKKYEEQKRWCYALGSYYDAMGTDELPETKVEAYESYSKLRNAIISGNPGFGKFNEFTIHDEWKNLLIDAEKYGSSISIYDITIGNLERGALDYKTRTATYNAKIDYRLGDRYNHTISIIEQGYKTVYKSDWNDLPEEWPLFSASTDYDAVYNIDGALVYTRDIKIYDLEIPVYINAFYELESKFLWDHETAGLYDYKFNIVDENGKELVKGKRWLLGDGDKISFSGISPELMDIIDSGKAFVNPVGCYLQYGKYNSADDKGGRTFMKNFPEVQLSRDYMVFICWNNKIDKITKNCLSTEKYGDYSVVNNIELIPIDDLHVQFLKTEVTQCLYKIVMGENPSYFWGNDLPVENISWYDAICFCNKLSEMKGYTPVYSVEGKTSIEAWNYIPHNGKSISGIIKQNEFADGFRLPTSEEWEYAAIGSEDYKYAGSNNIDEVGWDSYGTTNLVAQKKPNGYGLYDMSGNVEELCLNFNINNSVQSYVKNYGVSNKYCGFRVVRSSTEQISEVQKEKHEALLKVVNNNLEFVAIDINQIQMLKTEVPQALYEAVMGQNPSIYKGDELPVEEVSWYDAIYFCNKLSEIKELTPVYSVNRSTKTTDWNYIPHKGQSIDGTVEQNELADGFRLPTSEEWEYAAKGGEDYKYAGSNDIAEVAWYNRNSEYKSHPVAQKKPNGYGLYDMSGNVSEWCWNKRGSYSHVLRGGNYLNSYSYCDVSKVDSYMSYDTGSGYGFRIVRQSTFEEIIIAQQEAEIKAQLVLEALRNNPVITSLELVAVNEKQIQMLKTEVTQALYGAVMRENPSKFKGDDLPVESISLYDAIYFCNKLSEIKDMTPVYSVNGSTNTADWNYTPHKGKSINGIIEQNELADGFRLPTSEEWEYAAKGGEDYEYAGSNNIDEVGWYRWNSENKTHPVVQKKPNGYGLYDMSGNVSEWCWDDNGTNSHVLRGGDYSDISFECDVGWVYSVDSNITSSYYGFRVVRRFISDEIFETQQEAEQEQLESEIEGQRTAEEQRGIAGNEKIIKNIIDHIGLASINEMRVQVFKTEVTQALYEAVMGNNPSYFKGDDLPVENISWYDAIYFCNKLSEIMGLLPVYIVNGSTNTADWKYTPHTKATIISSIIQDEQANGFRLPTKEEWQYAAKGGESYKYAGNDDLDDLGWYKENSDNKTHPVAQKEANSYGLYDMSGNVKEWCWDAWGNEYRVMMNGSYLDDASTCRITKVNGNLASNISHDTGFRIVQSIK